MNTKTLLVAAATLAAGALASQAQVYSQNVVGYYNVSVGPQSFNIIANQLINGTDSSQTNDNINAVLSSGLASDPNGALNTVLYYWTGSGYNTYQYYVAADAEYNYGLPSATNGFYDANGDYINVSLSQGGGSFLYNPATTNITVTFVGTVPQGTNVLGILPGFNLLSIVPPVSTNLASSFTGFPGTSDPNGVTNDVLYQWTGSGYNTYQYYLAADAVYNYGLASATNGFYDANGNFVNAAPTVGQSFFILHIANSDVAWTNSFIVQ